MTSMYTYNMQGNNWKNLWKSEYAVLCLYVDIKCNIPLGRESIVAELIMKNFQKENIKDYHIGSENSEILDENTKSHVGRVHEFPPEFPFRI